MTEPKVQGLGGFGLEVPDLAEAEAFYGTFGLVGERRGDGAVLQSPGRGHDECVLRPGKAKRLHHVSFFVAADALARFADKLRAAGLDPSDTPPDGWQRPGLWFRDPWGTWINLTPTTPRVRALDEAPRSNTFNRSERVDVPLWDRLERANPPLRIGHMLMFTPDWEKAEVFFGDTLGLWTSDKVDGKVAFMAAPAAGDVIDHHCFGLINSTHRGFQHASFQVPGFDDLGFGAWRMNEAGYKETFGPGRHALGSNLFLYIRDPWGSWVEYYSDMDKITAGWTPRTHQTLPYIWGPEWSPEFWAHEMNGNFEPRD